MLRRGRSEENTLITRRSDHETSYPSTTMAEAHVNIGSNLGDRHALIERAVAAIEAALHTVARRAPIERSEPWGYEGDNEYLNLGIAVEVPDGMSPLALHELLQSIQNDIDSSPHRTPDGGYADRCIDIDFIAMGDTVADSPQLTLPHPRMHLREFVLRPIVALSPGWRHPIQHLTAAELLSRL